MLEAIPLVTAIVLELVVALAPPRVFLTRKEIVPAIEAIPVFGPAQVIIEMVQAVVVLAIAAPLAVTLQVADRRLGGAAAGSAQHQAQQRDGSHSWMVLQWCRSNAMLR